MSWTEERKAELLSAFEKIFPAAKSELQFENPFQLLCAVLLSAQCTDKKVNQVTPQLFSRFPNSEKLALATQNEIEGIIREVNYYRTKAKHLIATAQILSKEFAGEIPRRHEELLTLPGVGNKTANVVLSELGAAHALAVDTHVFRVSRRLGLTRGKNVKAVELSLKKQFSSNSWRSLHHSLILHGRRTCKARNPLCQSCGVISLCSTGSRIRVTSP